MSQRSFPAFSIFLLFASLGAASSLAAQQGQASAGQPTRPGLIPDQPRTVRVSVDRLGVELQRFSTAPSISDRGRYLAFVSADDGVVPGDTNGFSDVFVRDLRTGAVERVSIASNGTQGDGGSWGTTSISGDGRFVVFDSAAANLVAGDANAAPDVFLHDRWTGETRLVSVDAQGGQASGASYQGRISADGRIVAFTSEAADLVAGDNNGAPDVFVHELETGVTVLASANTAGELANGTSYYPSLSADGRFVAYSSDASNLAEHDWAPYYKVYVHDRLTGQTEIVSVDSFGQFPNAPTHALAEISADGNFVVFSSQASNLDPEDANGLLADVFVRDRGAGTTALVSRDSQGGAANGDSFSPSVSADGRFIAFSSMADNLATDDQNFCPDNFVHDRATGQTYCVTVTRAGRVGDNFSWSPRLAADARFVVFSSLAGDLVRADGNLAEDVFVRNLPR